MEPRSVLSMETTAEATVSPVPDAVFRDASTPNFDERQREKEGDARRRIAFILVISYVALLAMNLVVPILAVEIVGSGETQIAALKSASENVAALLTGVAGVIGFVLGYYFKAEDQKKGS